MNETFKFKEFLESQVPDNTHVSQGEESRVNNEN